MNVNKHILVLSLVVAVSACSDGYVSVGNPPVKPGVGDLTLAFYNNLTTATAESNIIVDFNLGSAEPLITNVHYDEQSIQRNLYTITTKGTSTIVLNVSNSSNMASLASSSVSVESGNYYTVVALGDVDNGTTDAVLFKQNRTAPDSGKSNIRFIHSLSNLNTTALDVELNSSGASLVVGLDIEQASSYTSITAPASAGDPVTFDLTQSGNVIGSGVCSIRPGLNYEAVIIYSDFNLTTPTVVCHSQ